MRKKLDTRFPAARIKKIMQADEDVGKIALAVPVLVSKALELFLQDLCDRTYEITLQRGAKTMSSLHLKHCVQRYNVFDFLRDIVSRVPDYSHGHSDSTSDDRIVSRRRKAISDDGNDTDEEFKRSRMLEMSHTSSSGRGRGRGRGRGSGSGTRCSGYGKETLHHELDSETSTSVQAFNKEGPSLGARKDHLPQSRDMAKETTDDSPKPTVRHFDLNVQVVDAENEDTIQEANNSSEGLATETKHEEIPGWSLSDVDKMAIDPLQLAHLSKSIEEDEEDYDAEG